MLLDEVGAGGDIGGFFAAIGVDLPDRGGIERPVRCFANPGAHAHGDRHPSCSVNVDSGLWHCKACGAAGNAYQAALALGLSKNEALRLLGRFGLRGEGGGDLSIHAATVQRSGCTLEQYAAAKKLSEAFLRSLGVAQFSYLGAPALRIPYRDGQGTEVAVRFRTALEKGETDDRFRWRKGSRPILYGLDQLEAARVLGMVVMVEGESCCHTLWARPFPAVGVPGASAWKEEWAAALEGIAEIYVVIEPDAGGKQMLDSIGRSVLRDRVRLVHLAGDVSDLFLDDPDGFDDAMQKAIRSAIPWREHTAQQRSSMKLELERRSAKLALEPNLLERLDQTLTRLGLVGERNNARLIYLALTSRLLDQPVSVVVKGPSAGGKSHLVETLLRLFPEHSYFARTGMSDRSLAFTEESLSHRFIVLFEATSMASETYSYFVRTLLSEGRVSYEVTEKSEGGGFTTRHVDKEGPTGLLVTTTAIALHPENETRMLSLRVSDTAEQTRAVLLGYANTNPHSNADLDAWLALQELLELDNPRVLIPYAATLLDLIPPVAVRLRRDIRALLTLIKAHTLLHRATRETTDHGRLIATIDDYATVRQLMHDTVSEGVEATVSHTIRETVNTVASLTDTNPNGVPLTKIAAQLDLDKSAASRRCKDAANKGYLRNHEIRPGRPARYLTDEQLPDDLVILPDAAVLQDRCTVAPLPADTAPPSPESDAA